MEEKALQQQVLELNQKVDLLLEYVNEQRLKTNQLEDLFADLSIVGKDVYDTAVEELENRQVELDPDQLKSAGLRLLRNIENMSKALEAFESMADFMKDASPIANELIIEFTHKMHELDQRGYFEFFRETGRVFDNIVSHYSPEDVTHLADNVVSIMETVKSMTQPEMMNAINNAIKVYGSIDTANVPQFSIWQLLKEMRKPEMKRAMGFMVVFMRNLTSK
ncbi:DUF1641 domain-containing protein [Sunxiuqinia sp. A32]|uniref:DUF1641 domain-containing protein n=1 Tax=Sunxiuqinia sp. A32 TaxID=3461496 RepID=UPI0040451B82